MVLVTVTLKGYIHLCVCVCVKGGLYLLITVWGSQYRKNIFFFIVALNLMEFWFKRNYMGSFERKLEKN